MALGYQVTKNILDTKSAEAVVALRSAFDKVETFAVWLSNNPGSGATDPLVTQYEYTEDEAYILRVFFENLDAIRIANANTFDIGRKVTGLE